MIFTHKSCSCDLRSNMKYCTKNTMSCKEKCTVTYNPPIFKYNVTAFPADITA